MIKKIILTGTHHSGKTTLIEKYKKNKKINVMDELVRALATQTNFCFTPEKIYNYAFSELALLNFYFGMAQGVDLLQDNKPWLFDRCILDPLYYISYFKVNLPLKKNTLYKQGLFLTKKLIDSGYFKNTEILLLDPIPIVKHDGFRLGEEEQMGIYKIAISILNTLGLSYKKCSSKKAKNIIDFYINN